MAKVGQVYHIGHDPTLHDTETGRKAECRALNITEELGQVSAAIYIKWFAEESVKCTIDDENFAFLRERKLKTACMTKHY